MTVYDFYREYKSQEQHIERAYGMRAELHASFLRLLSRSKKKTITVESSATKLRRRAA